MPKKVGKPPRVFLVAPTEVSLRRSLCRNVCKTSSASQVQRHNSYKSYLAYPPRLGLSSTCFNVGRTRARQAEKSRGSAWWRMAPARVWARRSGYGLPRSFSRVLILFGAVGVAALILREFRAGGPIENHLSKKDRDRRLTIGRIRHPR